MAYLYIKALHIFFVISWFAGLFYLPRLYVNLAMAKPGQEYQRLLEMARKLFLFMRPLSLMAVVFGLWLWLGYDVSGGWMHIKLVLVLLLLGYQHYCGKIYRSFASGNNQRSHTWYRVFNEVPTIILLAIVILVVVKPF